MACSLGQHGPVWDHNPHHSFSGSSPLLFRVLLGASPQRCPGAGGFSHLQPLGSSQLPPLRLGWKGLGRVGCGICFMVFDANLGEMQIFLHSVFPFPSSVLNGKNVCIFKSKVQALELVFSLLTQNRKWGEPRALGETFEKTLPYSGS